MARDRRPKLAVWKFTSCDGCQLRLLNCEDELLELAEHVRIAVFAEATRAVVRGPYDLSLVEGSVSTPEEVGRIHRIRRTSRTLVAIGACATTGGIQALRNTVDVERYVHAVYPHPEFIRALQRSSPIAEYVRVDAELHGCPIDRAQLLELIEATLRGRAPDLPTTSVCSECKRRGTVCVLVARGEPCLGPVTRAGCGAICPAHGRGCYACFGPCESANPAPLSERLAEHEGLGAAELTRTFRGITGAAPPFHAESVRHER